MEDLYYCPECNNELERFTGCGCISYFCNTCNKLISKSMILSLKEMLSKSAKVKNAEE